MYGYESTKVIKQQYHIPVITITPSIIISEEVEANKIFNDLLEKPLSYNDLIKTLCEHLDYTMVLTPQKDIKEYEMGTIILANICNTVQNVQKYLLGPKKMGIWNQLKDLFLCLRNDIGLKRFKSFTRPPNNWVRPWRTLI